MMRYAPFASALGDKHGEARWTRYRFAIYHSGKRVEAGDFDGAIVDCDCAPFVNRVRSMGRCNFSGAGLLAPVGKTGRAWIEVSRPVCGCTGPIISPHRRRVHRCDGPNTAWVARPTT